MGEPDGRIFGSRCVHTDRELNIFQSDMTIFFSFSFFWGCEDTCVGALLRFVCIFKEPVFSRNTFGKPFRRPTVHCGNRTHCPNVCVHSFSRKHFVATKLFHIVFGGPYAFLVGPYAFFRPYRLHAYSPHTRTFFLWFSKEIAHWAVWVI